MDVGHHLARNREIDALRRNVLKVLIRPLKAPGVHETVAWYGTQSDIIIDECH